MERKKRERKPAIEEDTSNLPCEVIFIILSKLPVKSLMRFRCVCKPWLALIIEPQFIKSHLTEAIKSDRQRVIRPSYHSDCFYSVDYETSDNSVDALYFPIKEYHKATILCSCNGMVLLGLDSDKMYVLWNPSTREYKRFSRPYSQPFPPSSICGICYDSSVDNYKVVFILPDSNNYKYFMVYTFETNSWTETRELPSLIMHFRQNAVTVSGAPHWVVSLEEGDKLEYFGEMHSERGGHNNKSVTHTASKASETSSNVTYAIIYFDVVEEKFKKVPPPNWICESDIFDLTIMRGCLSIYVAMCNMQQTDVWVMKEYGERNSWTYSISIPNQFKKVVPRCLFYPRPLSFTNNGEVLVLADTWMLLLYNPKENEFSNMTPSAGLDYLSYVDSLVLPKCDKLSKSQQHKHNENGKRKEF